jgi:hypothetical protein
MKYQPEVGDILICTRNSFVSKLIRSVTGGKWSHAAIVAETWGQIGVIEAQSNGVNFKLWDIWREKWGYTYTTFRFNADFNEKELMLKAFSKCGETKYDWFTFVGRLFGSRKNRGKAKEEKAFICSEYVAWVWGLKEIHDITPQELHDYLTESKHFYEI